LTAKGGEPRRLSCGGTFFKHGKTELVNWKDRGILGAGWFGRGSGWLETA